MWAEGGLQVDEELIDAMRACGATPESVAAYRARVTEAAEAAIVDILPENWHALNVFLGMGDQWRVAAGLRGMHYLGLDFAALGPVLQECRSVRPRQSLDRLMPQLRTLVNAARPILNQD